MSWAWPFFAIGLLLLILLGFVLRRSAGGGAGAEQLSDAQKALTALQSELLPIQFVERIFSSVDWDYVSHQATPDILRMFFSERRALALSWLRQTHGQVAKLMGLHARFVRGKADLNPAMETVLGINYLLYELSYLLMVGLIWMRGPAHTRKLVAYAVGFAGQLCTISEGLLASITSARVEKAEPHLTSGSSAN